MNRLSFIKILKETFELFLAHNAEIEITEERREEYETVINQFSVPVQYDEDIKTYHEVEFLCFLFENVPYFMISKVLQDYEKNLYLLFNQTPKKHLANNLSSCLRELSPNYNRRINSEICKHVSILLNFYLLYNKEELNHEELIQKQVSVLKRNICNPKTLFNLNFAEEALYEQQSIYLEEKKDPVREEVSKRNYENASEIEKNYLGLVQKLDSFESYIAFRQYIKEFCKKQSDIEIASMTRKVKHHEENKTILDNDFRRIGRLIDIYLDSLQKTIRENFKKEEQKNENANSLLFQIENW